MEIKKDLPKRTGPFHYIREFNYSSTATYAEAVKAIKEAILESRYRAARLVNKEILALYYAIGG